MSASRFSLPAANVVVTSTGVTVVVVVAAMPDVSIMHRLSARRAQSLPVVDTDIGDLVRSEAVSTGPCVGMSLFAGLNEGLI